MEFQALENWDGYFEPRYPAASARRGLWAASAYCGSYDIEMIRQVNTALVLNTLRQSDELLSRPAIAQRLGLSKVTVANIVKELIDGRLVTEAGVGLSDSRGGRKPLLISLDRERKRIVSAKLSGALAEFSIADISGRELRRISFLVDNLEAQPLKDILELGLAKVLAETSAKREDILGLVILRSHSWGQRLAREALGSQLREDLGFPVCLEDLGRARAFGESWFGRRLQPAKFFFLNIDLELSGHALRDNVFDDSVCGFGSCYLSPLAPAEGLGEPRTVDRSLNGQALLAEASSMRGRPVEAEELLLQARLGRSWALSLYRDYGYNLGCALSLLFNMTGLPKIVLGGFVSEAWPFFAKTMRQALDRHMEPGFGSAEVRPLRPHLRDGLLGASALGLDRWVFNIRKW